MNYYEILKVTKNATSEEIKNSYKSLVKKYHPDLYVGDKGFAEQKIKEINEAYDILSNPETKLEYDEYLNPTSEVSSNYDVSRIHQNDEKNASNQSTEESGKQKTFSQWIIEKFNKLEKKRQLQIFIIILILILSLFLINLIQVQYYLTNKNDSSTNTSNPDDNQFENNNFYNENEFQTIDDLFYDLFEKYEESQESIYSSNDLYENAF